MATSNEELRDALIRRQIYLLRFGSGLTARVLKLLRLTERDIQEEIEERVAELAVAAFTSRTLARLRVLQKSLESLRRGTWNRVLDTWDTELTELARVEATYVAGLITEVAPVKLDVSLPSGLQLAAITSSRPMEGALLRDWARRASAAEIQRIMGAVQIGLTRGDNVKQITNRVMGTKSLDRRDGALHLSSQHAETITRTAVNHVSNQAKGALYAANSDIIDEEVYVATLDSRTTPICRSLDGQVYPVGRGPRPPLHLGCRSLRVALINGSLIGNRPAVPATKRELEGLSQRDRGRRIRELAGQVPASLNYPEWLKRQTQAFQDDVLGVKRGRLFRDGGLTLDRFVDRNGRQYTLRELRDREPEAFRNAGLFEV